MANERERQVRCTAEGCGAIITVEIPEGIMINKPTVSMVVMVHEKASFCPNCGQAYSFVLRGLNLRSTDVAWLPVEFKKPEPDIIIPPSMLTKALLDKKGN
jgi:hypothetical protein